MLERLLPLFKSSTISAYVLHQVHTLGGLEYSIYETNTHSNTNLLQVLVDGPSDDKTKAVPRHDASLSYMSLTGIIIPKLPRAAGTGALKKKWDEHKVTEKYEESNFAKSRQRSIRRKQLSDFDRFKVMRLKKQVRLRSPWRSMMWWNFTKHSCWLSRFSLDTMLIEI